MNISSRLQGTMFKCITEHPGFLSNCLDIYVLEASFYEFCPFSCYMLQSVSFSEPFLKGCLVGKQR